MWLQNRLPNKGNGWRIPYDEVFGKLPDLSFVRVFGSQAYAFVDPSLRKKLAPRAKDMLHVGHQEHGRPATCSSTPRTTRSTSPASR